MNGMLEKLLKALKEKHGDEINVKEESYFLFFNDGHFFFALDHDTKELQVTVHFTDSGSQKIYYSNSNIADVIEAE